MPEGFFAPVGVDTVHVFLRKGMPKEGNPLQNDYAYLRNVAYNLQYLEYLSHVIDKHMANEEQLHFTVSTLTYKTFVITGMSVVEAILWYVLKNAAMQRTSEWEEVQQMSTTYKQNGETFKLTNLIYKKLEVPEDYEMTLDAMIKRVESKNLLGVNTQVYKDLNHLRKLRNRVHIKSVQHDKDTDWWNFNHKHMKLMKSVLSSILHSGDFKPDDEQKKMLDYLKVEEPAAVLAGEEEL